MLIYNLKILYILKMPDKIYRKGCGSNCIRCWSNKLKHANPTIKKWLKKNGNNYEIIYPEEKHKKSKLDKYIFKHILNIK